MSSETDQTLESDKYYFNMKDPDTGNRYDIPLLSRTDPDYVSKYIYFMKLKEKSPSAFEAAMRWD